MVLVTSVIGLMWSKSSSMSRQTGVFSPMEKEPKHVFLLEFSFITIEISQLRLEEFMWLFFLLQIF